jgi:hypothetical protein
MTRKTRVLPLLAALLLSATGCQHQATVAGRLEVQPRALSLPYPQLATVRLTWTPSTGPGGAGDSSETPSEPLVFLHLLDARRQVLRTFDHPFPEHWAEATPVSYDVKLFQSALAPPLDPGKYRLSVGLYDHRGRRWALDGLGEPIGRQEYLAAEVEVPPQPAGPHFAFSGSWLPIEAGSDRQVVARRWLSEQAGEIRVDAIPGPGTLWLSFRIPPGDGDSEKLVFHDPASNTPGAVVRDTCGAVETGISGPGPHDVEMPVEGPGPDGSCRISLVPNFHIVSTSRSQPRSVSLENAAWIPGVARGATPASGPGGGAPPPAGSTRPPAPPAGATAAPPPPSPPSGKPDGSPGY